MTNSAISEEEAKSGKCGKIIPKDATVVPKGAYVYELNKDDENQFPFPGFIENTREDGKCLPCCFKTWKGKKQKEAKERCESQMKTGDETSDSEDDETSVKKQKAKKPKKIKQTAKSTQYIISLDTYPVTSQRWGFLPIPVQLFLQIDYRQAIDPNNPALLKPEREVLLRYGVERSLNQSFLGCFADIYAHRQELNSVPSIADFKQILIEVINLDIFAKAHNGSLLSAFWKSRVRNNSSEKIKVSKETRKKYKDTEFALSLDLKDSAKKHHLDDAIIAYENFIHYLSDPNVKIDHQYLWDFVCDDNRRIIPKGLNLVILEIHANDIIDKIELVCPTNLYSRNQYDSKKDTVILLKHDEFYEPIYIYESNQQGPPNVTRFLSQKNVPIGIADILQRIEHATRKYCPGMPSLPKIYKFANPIAIQRLLGSLVKIGAKIESQVVNYQGKTIGLMVFEKQVEPNKQNAIYVPCAPSARLNMPIRYMDSLDIPKEYEKTIETLNRISMTAKIPCRPIWKIKEDGLVVGFLTETNQFVPIQPNEDIVMDGLMTYEGVNTFMADKTISTESSGDKTRMKMTKYIILESQFYHAFRNRIRTLFSEFSNRPIKNEIRKIAEDKTIIYSQKIERIENLIEQLIHGNIVFVDIDKSTLMDLAEVNECENTEDEGPNCLIKENGIAQLIVPKWHLISRYDNEKIYVGRIADELVRNERVKSIMYDTTNRLNSRTTDYQIKDNEFILVQSALTPEYFSELDSSRDTNVYATNTNYELANPSISVVYSNEKIPLSEQQKTQLKDITNKKEVSIPVIIDRDEPETLYENVVGEVELQPNDNLSPSINVNTVTNSKQTESRPEIGQQECLVKISKILGNRLQVWYRIFSKDAREYIFRDTATCTFQPIIHVVKSKLGEIWTTTDIKNKLFVAYSRLFETDAFNMLKIAKILREQGKSSMFDKFIKQKSKIILSPEIFQDIIMSDNYYISDMDIWVIANEYNLPIVVFNANGLKGFFAKVNDESKPESSDINTNWIKMGGDIGDKYHFIRSKIRVAKGSYSNKIYEYNLIVPEVKLTSTGEFEEMVVDSIRKDQLNTVPLVEALKRFF